MGNFFKGEIGQPTPFLYSLRLPVFVAQSVVVPLLICSVNYTGPLCNFQAVFLFTFFFFFSPMRSTFYARSLCKYQHDKQAKTNKTNKTNKKHTTARRSFFALQHGHTNPNGARAGNVEPQRCTTYFSRVMYSTHLAA